MATDEPGGLLAAVIARDAAQVLRLSVTYALLDGTNRIGIEHIRAAWALWRYCRASAAYVFGESLGDPVADRLLSAIRDAGRSGLDGRQRNALFAGHASRRQLETALALLTSKGLVVTETIETGGRPIEIVRASECEQSEQRALVGQRTKFAVDSVRDTAMRTKRTSEQRSDDEQSEISEQRSVEASPPFDDFDLERMFANDESEAS
jgi:DNA-binding PadR family transcriptional regulator